MAGAAGGAPLVVVTADEDAETVALVHETLTQALGRDLQVACLMPGEAAARRDLLQRADALLVPAWNVAEDEIPHLDRVQVVQSVWAGVDRIPVDALAAQSPHAWVTGGSGPNAPQVAEHALGLLLACTRRLVEHDRAARRGAWTQDRPGQRIAGSAVAVVGSGAIGRRLGRALAALDAEVTMVNTTGRSVEGLPGMDLDGLRAARQRFHAMVLALPLVSATRALVDAEWLQGMRPEAVLVNVGRGKLIVEDDLYAHLVNHPGFRAGLDVWWHYPKGGASRFAQGRPFGTLDNVVATPHVAFNVPGTREEMFRHAAHNVARVLSGARPDNVAVEPRRTA